MTSLNFSMAAVFLVYGLAFLLLGLTVFILNERDSALELSRVLWLLAAFGIIHGFLEWLDLWRVVRGDNPGLAAARPVVLLISFLFLFEFGRRLVRVSLTLAQRIGRAGRLLSPWIYAPLLLGIVPGVAISDEPMLALAIWSRYLPGFFGSCLAGAGFYLYCQNRIGDDAETSDFPGISAAWYVAAAAFVAYGVVGGLIGARGDWFPASVVNEGSFLATFGVPVQLLRAGCAVTVACSVGYLLQIFNYNNRRKLAYALQVGRRALSELYCIRSRFEAVMDSATEGIVGLDDRGDIVFVNDAALTMLGYLKGELIGKSIRVLSDHTVAPETCWPAENCPIFSTMRTGKIHRVREERFWRKNRTWFPVAYQTAALWDGDRIQGVVVAFRDTIEVKLAERRLHRIEFSRMEGRLQKERQASSKVPA